MDIKKSILFTVHSMGIGGTEVLLANIVNKLVDRGYRVDVVVTSSNMSSAFLLDEKVNIFYKEEPSFTLLKKIPYIRNFYQPGMWSERKKPSALYKYFVGSKKYDVEIAFFFGKPLKIVYGSPNSNSKKIYWVQMDYHHCTGCYMGFRCKKDAIAAYNKFDEIICVSNGVKESFIDVIQRTKNVNVIPNLMNVEKIRQLSNETINIYRNTFTFLLVGRLEEEKGILNLLSAIKKLNEQNLHFELWIIGDGSEESTIRKYISDNKTNNVKLLGRKNNPYPYIKTVDFLVSSSLHEAYGITIAEALILGTPVISTDCVGPRELLDGGKYGVLVENSVDGIYNGMYKILLDSEFRNRMRQLAKNRQSYFDAERILDQIEDVLK